VNFMASNTKTVMTLGVIALLVIASALAAPLFGFGAQKQQAVQGQTTGTPASPTSTAGTDSFAPADVYMNLKDVTNPTTAVTTTSVTAVAYDASTADTSVSSPTTAYIDSDASDSSGNIAFAAKKLYTGTSYKVKVYDNTASPTWYPVLGTITVPALNPALGASAVATITPDWMLTKIGTIADPMTANATGSAGGALQTGVTSNEVTNRVTINLSTAPAAITVRFPITFANTGVNTKLQNVVIRPMQDSGAVIPTTAFTGATMSYVSGTNLNIPANVLANVQNQLPIALGNFDDSTSGSYYFQVSLSNSSLVTGETYTFFEDDNGNYRATDGIAGQSGASPVNFTISTTN
jgi:hypothetical protein